MCVAGYRGRAEQRVWLHCVFAHKREKESRGRDRRGRTGKRERKEFRLANFFQ